LFFFDFLSGNDIVIGGDRMSALVGVVCGHDDFIERLSFGRL
jgi:hypothetical protein